MKKMSDDELTKKLQDAAEKHAFASNEALKEWFQKLVTTRSSQDDYIDQSFLLMEIKKRGLNDEEWLKEILQKWTE